MKNKKKSIIVTGAAVMLAAAMALGGGTYAYLQGTTKDVVNNFNTNKVLVTLEEKTGSNYNIIPGTEQAKDPKVTVDNTVDSYVYAIVTDNTNGLVKYDIADGWTLLNGWDGEHTKVYYREVTKDAAAKEFSVLAGDKVAYDAALENSDMVNPDGTLKDGLNLTFTAHAIQKDGFASPEAAFETAYTTVDTSTDLTTALQEGKTAVLTTDIALDNAYLNASGEVNIIGNGHKLTAPTNSPQKDNNRIISITDQTEPTTINIKDVDLVGPTTGAYTRGISVGQSKNVTINIEDSSLSASYYAFNFAFGNENVEINCKNTTIQGWAAMNIHTPNMKATFENCTLIGLNDKGYNEDGWNDFATVVVDNADGNPSATGASGGVFTFKDCRIEANQTTGNKQYFMSIRVINTTVDVENCTFFVNGEQIAATQEALSPYVSVYEEALDSFQFTIH